MIEKIEQQIKSENLKLGSIGQQSKRICKKWEESRSTNNKFSFLLSLIKTGLFLVFLLVIGVFSIPFAILANQVGKKIEDDRQE
jgi:hypothetical protein